MAANPSASAARRDRMPQNAVGGGLQAGLRPEEIDGARNVLSSAVAGRSYHPLFSSGRSDDAGYTTSSPGWRHDAPPSLFPAAPAGPPTDMSVAGPWGAGMGAGQGGGAPMPSPRPGADRGPQTTGAIPPPHGLTPEMIANATTTPSALFEPLNNVANAQSPSSLGGMLYPGQATSPSSVPGMHPMPGPFPSRPDIPQPQPLPPEIQPAKAVTDLPPLSAAGPSAVRPSPVRHPDNPTVGKKGPLGKGRARASKSGGQYNLRNRGDR